MWGVLWEVKSMSEIVNSSFGGKLFLHICKLEWFKSKQVWVDGNVFICSQGPYKAVNSDRGLAVLRYFRYFVNRRNFNCPHASVYWVHSIIFWEREDRGFWLCDVASLVMYCIDAPPRTVSNSKSLYRTALLFPILNGRYQWHLSVLVSTYRLL